MFDAPIANSNLSVASEKYSTVQYPLRPTVWASLLVGPSLLILTLSLYSAAPVSSPLLLGTSKDGNLVSLSIEDGRKLSNLLYSSDFPILAFDYRDDSILFLKYALSFTIAFIPSPQPS